MRTTSPSQSGPRRLLLSAALAAPLSVLLLGGTAVATPGNGNGNGNGNPQAAASASQDAGGHGRDAAPGQQRKAEPAAAEQPAPTQQAQPAERQPAKGGASGDTSQPQPISNADSGGTGANPGADCDHAYCSTRNGDASRNGNGGGQATGKPCAGCVGKADNKNPPGQAPDGSDRNNGYECDGNNGIGKTNPAHTGCTPGTTTPPPPPPPVCPPGSNAPACRPAPPTTPPTTTPPVCLPEGANGPQAPGCTPPVTPPASTPPAVTPPAQTQPAEVLSGRVVRPTVVPLSAVAPQRVAAPAEQVRPTVLPFTGTGLDWVLPLGLVALAGGVALVGLGRRDTELG